MLLYRAKTSSLFAVLLLVTVLFAGGCGANDPKKAIIGKWQADLGEVMGLGTVTEYMEFYENGTVSSHTDITSYIGDYKFLDENTVRIDWKEQGIFGHTPSEIFKFKIDGGQMIFTDEAGNSTTYFRPEALTKTAEAIATNPAGRSDADLSDLKGRIFFMIGTDIYSMNANGTDIKKIVATGGMPGTTPRFDVSPDEQKIAFEKTNDGIYVTSIDGSNTTLVISGSNWRPRWSPDGRQIAYNCDWEMCVANADGTDQRVLGEGLDPAWSPDGKYIVYSGVKIMSLDGTEKRTLAEGGEPAWSPDGKLIAYSGSDGIYIINPSNEPPLESRITVEMRGAISPTWSPDGKYIAFSHSETGDGPENIYVVDMSGNTRKITNSPRDRILQMRWIN